MHTLAGLFVAFALALGLAMPAPVAAQSSPPVVAGKLWLESSPEVRRAFLLGAANMIALEKAHASRMETPPSTAAAEAEGALRALSLDQLSERITRWYQANPGRQDVPVMGVVWLDVVKPAIDATP